LALAKIDAGVPEAPINAPPSIIVATGGGRMKPGLQAQTDMPLGNTVTLRTSQGCLHTPVPSPRCSGASEGTCGSCRGWARRAAAQLLLRTADAGDPEDQPYRAEPQPRLLCMQPAGGGDSSWHTCLMSCG
jgi:hypothetical protein